MPFPGEQFNEIEIPIGDNKRRYIFDIPRERPFVKDLFETPIAFMEGSTIEVEETLNIETVVKTPAFVSFDLEWYVPRADRGSYILFGDNGKQTGLVGEADEGRIYYDQVSLMRKTQYVVVPIAANDDLVLGVSRTNNCSFGLVPLEIETSPGVNVKGFQPFKQRDIFISSHAIEMYPVASGRVRQQVVRVGIYVKPGVSLSSVNYTMRIGGQAVTGRPKYIKPGECGLGARSCQEQLATLAADPQAGFYLTEAEANAAPDDSMGQLPVVSVEIQFGNGPDGKPCKGIIWGRGLIAT